ncbi:hypothetical protein [Nocardia donostiensis]|uniref:WXG100 family type VII secretion target n=1 Tax=Nocardia donostiensis TaxID=1538463 RepID=A0A1V2TLY3_9NOCA|nr:hypothetical protein [Nocardia donostiensis]ONM50537.1 hypothetical protein B0T46_01080 [Nocardia donostiensis]OQS17229.1 hypothetical protein B0T36_01085 [Nocardia donostiensis]OQS20817.1 hypothetical protein B0T44_09380 [Nocardia donostiensis]
MVDDRMLYTNAVHQRLISEMDGYYKDLNGFKDALVAARDKLIRVAWEDNDAGEAFKTRMDLLIGADGNGGELGDTHTHLEKLRDAIDVAFNNAKAADMKVYNAF